MTRNSKQLGTGGHLSLSYIIYYVASLLICAIMIQGFYKLGIWLGNGELVEKTQKIVTRVQLVKSDDCFNPLHLPVLGDYKNWNINNNMNAPKIINVGFPKCGSSTLNDFLSKGIPRGKQLSTIGYNVSHFWPCNKQRGHGECGSCMRNATEEGVPPLASCGNFAAYTQVDSVSKSECQFPQISYLNEIYNEEPSAIFLLPFRNVSDWIRSVSKWNTMRTRITTSCHFPEYNFTKEMGSKDEELKDLYCKHVKHIRKFVFDHPTITLIEYSIGGEGVGDYLAKLLPHMRLNGSLYGHKNINMKIKRNIS